MTFDDIVDLAEKAWCDVSAIDGREYQTMWCSIYERYEHAANTMKRVEVPALPVWHLGNVKNKARPERKYKI